MGIKYQHLEAKHNLDSPREIVPVLLSMFNPSSVIDIGCGIGTFLNVFKESGVKTVFGMDGKWVDETLLEKYIDKDEFRKTDLEKPFQIDKKFDLAICLEVAEHLKEEAADIFIESLVKVSDTIIFSAAIPLQSGQNHVNEQWPEYWVTKFKKHGFQFHDVLRPLFWNNKKIFPWYKQNIFLVTRQDDNIDFLYNNRSLKRGVILNIVHPDTFLFKAELLDEMLLGKSEFKLYFKLLAKKIYKGLRKIND